MQAKTMIQTIATTVILTAATSWGSMIWNFNDGTNQGWMQLTQGSVTNPAQMDTWNGSPVIRVRNEGVGTGGLYITGVNFVTDSTANYVQFSTMLENNPGYPFVTFRINLTTTNGHTYEYDMIPGAVYGSAGDSFVDKKLNLFTDFTPGGAYTMTPGDVVSDITAIYTWGYSFGIYADNIMLVPEPVSLALLALGGCCLLRRRR